MVSEGNMSGVVSNNNWEIGKWLKSADSVRPTARRPTPNQLLTTSAGTRLDCGPTDQ